MSEAEPPGSHPFTPLSLALASASATLPKGSQFHRELTTCPLPAKVAAGCCPGLEWLLQRSGHKRLQGAVQFSSWTGEEPPRPGAAGQNMCGPGGPDGVPPLQENLKLLLWWVRRTMSLGGPETKVPTDMQELKEMQRVSWGFFWVRDTDVSLG